MHRNYGRFVHIQRDTLLHVLLESFGFDLKFVVTDRQFEQDIGTAGIGGRSTGQPSFGLASAYRCTLNQRATRVLDGSTNAPCDLLRPGNNAGPDYRQQTYQASQTNHGWLSPSRLLLKVGTHRVRPRKIRSAKQPGTESSPIIGTLMNRSIIGKEYSMLWV